MEKLKQEMWESQEQSTLLDTSMSLSNDIDESDFDSGIFGDVGDPIPNIALHSKNEQINNKFREVSTQPLNCKSMDGAKAKKNPFNVRMTLSSAMKTPCFLSEAHSEISVASEL